MQIQFWFICFDNNDVRGRCHDMW